ncbi:hypothetical protein SMULJ23_0055 [Streptococcus mutans LJ23]|nr:hypothetical protein SMULJ23_0055 [Streptococcus mutans LJ23]
MRNGGYGMSALFYDTLAAIWISIAGVDARWGH